MAGRGYSIAGKKPLGPVAQARGELMLAVLDETAADLRGLAKLARGVGAEEGEPLEAEAEAYERALYFARIRMGGATDAPLPPAAIAKPVQHYCDQPGCGAMAGHGFFVAGEPELWACDAHKDAIGARYQAEKAERARIQAEKLKPKTELAGIGDRLI